MNGQKNISLPFDFPFYWNHYSNLYIVTPGYLTLYEQPVVGQSEIPNDNLPNGIIAPFWAPLMPDMNTGWIRYMTGGVEPNRYLVVEWHDMQDSQGNLFTFEAILYENGNILFQYQQIGEEYWCASTGIESETTYYSLAYPVWCDNYPAEGTAVLFTRPGPVARFSVDELNLGKFAKPGSDVYYYFNVVNNGSLGVDTFDFDISTSHPIFIEDATNWQDFTDTDSDGKIDTGPMMPGSGRDVQIRMYLPRSTPIYTDIFTSVTITSSLDTTRSKTVLMETTVPAPFTQTFSENYPRANYMELNWAYYETIIKTSPFTILTRSPIVAETLDNIFINIWENHDWADYNESSYLQYAMIDSFGLIVKPYTNLTQKIDSEEYHYYDKDPAVSVAADGKIGIAWYSYAYNENADLHNYNIWYAILDSNGRLISGPVNLTNNTVWAHPNDVEFIKFGSPGIAATTDNRFMITWDQSTVVNGESLEDIYFSILQSNGASIIPPLKITDGLADSVGYKNPLVTTVDGNRFFITYVKLQKDSTGWVKQFPYMIYGSNGIILKTETETGLYGNIIDVTQLSGGNLLMASAMGGSNSKDVGYTILSGIDYSTLYNSPGLEHPASEIDEIFGLSVTKDSDNHGILTWTDDEGEYLYYALIAGSGEVLDGPSIFHRTIENEEDSFYLSSNGSSSTTNSKNPTKNTDVVVSFNSDLYGVAPGGQVAITIHYASHGFATAMAPYLTLTLSEGLTYISDTLWEPPYINGNQFSWFLPYLEYGEGGEFTVYVTIPTDAQIGNLYPIDMEIITDEIGWPEAYPEDNIDQAQIMSSEQLFLPTLLK